MVVTNIKISKIESKSQLSALSPLNIKGCYKYQNFKDRKQITTVHPKATIINKLLQISKFQRSKANHNSSSDGASFFMVVTNIKISKIESKSQHAPELCPTTTCCYKYQNFKDRKQITTILKLRQRLRSCYKYQNFKDRKQITTT